MCDADARRSLANPKTTAKAKAQTEEKAEEAAIPEFRPSKEEVHHA
jgi:hypothetical protein